MKKMKMEYKKAMANDTGRIVSLVHHTIMTVYPQYYPEKVVDFFCGLHCEKNIRRDVEKGNVGVVYSGERLAGTGSFDGNHITRVYVAPEFQRQGYGSFIMEQLEARIGKYHDEIIVDASLPASTMYESRGYKTLRHERIDVGGGVMLVYEVMKKERKERWLTWAVELQSLAQAGLYYAQDRFDVERYERIREISAEMVSFKSEVGIEKVKNLFCSEAGYQTPKLDTRAAIFKEDKILLVKEMNGTWALPGGWVDVGLSVKENVIKEAKEEAGLDVTADMIIAVQDREKHNLPAYTYKICKIFVLCTSIGGTFKENNETIDSACFSLDELPELAIDKNTEEQIAMCFEAYHSKNWKTYLD